MISAGDRWRHLVRECCASAANPRVGLAEARSLLRCDIPKFTRRRNARPVSWKIFSAATAELKSSSRFLRSRVVLGAGPRRSEGIKINCGEDIGSVAPLLSPPVICATHIFHRVTVGVSVLPGRHLDHN
jgi:hypothetical protein